MKKSILVISLLISITTAFAQKKGLMGNTPCNGTADNIPGIYTNHTNPKYTFSLKAASPQEKTYMTNQLIAIEKLEEASRKNFQLTGCVARVHFSNISSINGSFHHTGYEYQMAAYQNVCHVTQHIVKTVDEYRTVLRVDINPTLAGNISPSEIGIGNFNISKYPNSIQYDIPIDYIEGKGSVNNPSNVSKYISERMLLTGRSDNYKNYHADFLKLNNGEGYVENWQGGDRYAKFGPNSYQFIDRHYLITKPGIPLLIPVSRKQYLQDMLDYLEIEKANFEYEWNKMIKGLAGSNSDYEKKQMDILQADKAAYPKLYEARKEKLKQLLANQKEEWLQKQAIVGNPGKTLDANERLKELGNFYDKEEEYKSALYILNPEYFKQSVNQPAKPIFMEVQFRYELSADKGFSKRLFDNFEKNFDMDALRKMVE
ncbi:MAG: hypothetical protein OJF59_000128 [Cytophagales bacterium]|jgi:hypothetical protein|nr:hypothetical protein [Bacteroidota bacterium]WHZ06375.1 MAG: hypothetical protein OJF59_000128 [Cytophagales bacterium]